MQCTVMYVVYVMSGMYFSCIHAFIYIYICVYSRMCVCIYVSMYMYKHMCTHMDLHTVFCFSWVKLKKEGKKKKHESYGSNGTLMGYPLLC